MHRIEIEDRRAGSKLELPVGVPTLNATFDQTADLSGRHNLYFYVPKGTTVVGGFAEGPGRLVNGSSKKVHEFEGKPGYFSVPVGAGEDGQLWKFEFTSGRRVLLTVPPQMARSAEKSFSCLKRWLRKTRGEARPRGVSESLCLWPPLRACHPQAGAVRPHPAATCPIVIG